MTHDALIWQVDMTHDAMPSEVSGGMEDKMGDEMRKGTRFKPYDVIIYL